MNTLQAAVYWFANVLEILVFVRCIISWLPIRREGPIVKMLFALTEPILGPIRSMIEKSPLGGPGMMLDFSPIIALMAISIISRLIIQIL